MTFFETKSGCYLEKEDVILEKILDAQYQGWGSVLSQITSTIVERKWMVAEKVPNISYPN